MNNVYKIESYSDYATGAIARYIRKKGGNHVVVGFAILTDFSFDTKECQTLLAFISNISDHMSDVDWNTWQMSLRSAA